jgi:uncharacterized membrane protein
MISLYVLIVSTVIFRLIGLFGVGRLGRIANCIRYGFAVMFIFTGVSHFTTLKADFVRMIPFEPLRNEFIVYLTGAMEIAGALWLASGKFMKYACLYLILFLLAVLPANIYASIHGISIAGKPPTDMYLRILVQFFYIALLAYVATRKGLD